VPNPRDPLRFTRAEGQGSVRVLAPEMMYTDGGSTPRAAQLLNGLNPWGYAPAYMVHDWLFVARHCLTDGTPTPSERTVADMEFRESAEIIAEAIKTLVAAGRVREADVAPRVISGAVAGPISYRRWTVEGACAGDRVTPEHRAAALSGIPGAAAVGIRRGWSRWSASDAVQTGAQPTICPACIAPDWRFTSRPPEKATIVGIPRIRYFAPAA